MRIRNAINHSADSVERASQMLRRDLRLSKGQAFVELALVLPVFTLLLVGIAEVGRLAYASIEVNNAARAGVSYAAQTSTTAGDNQTTGGIVLAAKQDAGDIFSGNLTVTPTYSCSCEGPTGTITSFASCDKSVTNLTSCPSTSRIVEFVQVNTSAPVGTLFHFPGIPSTVTLRGQATMRVQQ
jgi:Flp pilus assembly protein TadG